MWQMAAGQSGSGSLWSNFEDQVALMLSFALLSLSSKMYFDYCVMLIPGTCCPCS